MQTGLPNNFNNNNKILSGWWTKAGKAGTQNPEPGIHAIKTAINQVTRPVIFVHSEGDIAAAQGGTVFLRDSQISECPGDGYPLCAYAPRLHPEDLGDPVFKKTHGVRYAYIAGAMANGITSVNMVEAAGLAGMIGFFGAAGLPLNQVEAAAVSLKQRLKDRPFGFNLIHSPNDPQLESAVTDLYLRHGIRLISASAYLDLTLPLVYFRIKGIHQDAQGNIVCPNKVIAKVSRVEVAAKFFSPPPDKLLAQLLDKKMITPEEAELAKFIPWQKT